MATLAERYGFSRVTRLGSKQCGSVAVDENLTLYISYGTIVAFHLTGFPPTATAQKFGVTTTRQLSAMLRNDGFREWDTVDATEFAAMVDRLGYSARYNRAPVFFSK